MYLCAYKKFNINIKDTVLNLNTYNNHKTITNYFFLIYHMYINKIILVFIDCKIILNCNLEINYITVFKY